MLELSYISAWELNDIISNLKFMQNFLWIFKTFFDQLMLLNFILESLYTYIDIFIEIRVSSFANS